MGSAFTGPDDGMTRARLDVALPEHTWAHDLTTQFSAATFRIVSVFVRDGVGFGILEVEADDPLAVLGAMGAYDDVADLDLLWSDEDAALVQFASDTPALMLPALRAGVPLETPFEVRDGRATWQLTTPRERLSALGEQLDAAGIVYELESVVDLERDSPAAILTDRQREVLLHALGMGYYDVPRRATLTEVADSLGVAKATASDVLHRAESHLIEWFASEHLGN